MRGIILAGGPGTRLYPATRVMSKQLLPLYDKPMIYYPLSTLMSAGIREMLIISTPADTPRFRELLGDGSEWGLSLTYEVQPRPEGIAQAFLIGRPFIDDRGAALILGDNFYYGHGLPEALRRAVSQTSGATIFGYHVSDPRRYGVVELGPGGEVLSIEEKPNAPRSNHAICGLYFFDRSVSDFAAGITPSARGELEIVDVLAEYQRRRTLRVELLGRGIAWLDTGTHEALARASNFIETIEERQRLKIGCPEEMAYRMGFIDAAQLRRLGERVKSSGYGEYLLSIAGS